MRKQKKSDFLNTKQAAEYLGCMATNSLEMTRSYGSGPKYYKVGQAVFYKTEDLDEYLLNRKRRTTKLGPAMERAKNNKLKAATKPAKPCKNQARLDTPEAAKYLGDISARTLARWRVKGTGPRFSKVGGRVHYTVSDLDKYFAARMVTSEAAKYLGGIAARTLEQWRHDGIGPLFSKEGNRVRYMVSDLDKYLASRKMKSTTRSA